MFFPFLFAINNKSSDLSTAFHSPLQRHYRRTGLGEGATATVHRTDTAGAAHWTANGRGATKFDEIQIKMQC
jgi:hypothetical protein